jgi:hypothetical protein
MAAMPRSDELSLADLRPVRVRPRQVARAFTVLRLQDAPGHADAVPACGAPTATRHDAVLLTLGRAVRGADVVCDLGAGGFACLMSGALDRERLSLLAWRLIDALRHPSGPGPAIGAAIGRADGATYRQLVLQATAAMHRARWQQSGFAVFDQRQDAPWAPGYSTVARP